MLTVLALLLCSQVDPCWGPRLGQKPFLGQEFLLSTRSTEPVVKLMLRLEKHKLLFNNQESIPAHCQSTSQYSSGRDTKYIGGSSKRIGKRVEGYSWQQWCGGGPGTDAALLSVLVWGFLVVVMATINWHGIGGCVIQHANVIQWAYNEAQVLLEVKSSSIGPIAGSNQFLFLQLPLETKITVIGLYSGRARSLILGK